MQQGMSSGFGSTYCIRQGEKCHERGVHQGSWKIAAERLGKRWAVMGVWEVFLDSRGEGVDSEMPWSTEGYAHWKALCSQSCE